MTRKLNNWIESYLKYADHTEAPKRMHFWAAVSVIAGALRRKVWIDQTYFRWYPSFYIIFVAKPGVVSKTTTLDIGMDLLREIPGIKFGPDILTWQSMMTTFAGSCESFEYNGMMLPMSPITFASGELGNLIDPQNKDLINLMITLWDGKKKIEKTTKGSGNDTIESPWINMIAATTPHWIADNMPAATVGGGFTSRCVFVYAEKKERYIPYPKLEVKDTDEQLRLDLLDDLNNISLNMVGEMELTREAVEWGMEWYERNWSTRSEVLEDERLDGYVARKQTHLHKLAMILSASRSNDLLITRDDLQLAEIMLNETEEDLSKVFSRIGRSAESIQFEGFLTTIKKRGLIPYEEAYRIVHQSYQDFSNFEDHVTGAIRAGYIEIAVRGTKTFLKWKLEGADKSYGL